MILQCYAVMDKAVGNFLPPFYTRSQGEALRSFSDACNSADSNFAKHASDFTLYALGTFDDSSGLFATGDPVRVVSALQCVVASGVDVAVEVAQRAGNSSAADRAGA